MSQKITGEFAKSIDEDLLAESISTIIDVHLEPHYCPNDVAQRLAEDLAAHVIHTIDTMEFKHLVLELPSGITNSSLVETAGVLFNASTSYVDWDVLRNGDTGVAIHQVGRLLLSLSHQLGEKGK